LRAKRIEIFESAHPVPDAASVTAARRLLETVKDLRADDVVLCLMSGGASSLIVRADRGSHARRQAARQSRASQIRRDDQRDELRTPSLVGDQGRRLGGGCHPAKVVTLLISDVPGDRPMDIGSGPTVAIRPRAPMRWRSSSDTASSCPRTCWQVLESGRGESVKPDDRRLAGNELRFIATPQLALEAAAKVGRDAGTPCHIPR
jgi:hydroxypyruvate reductase